MKKILSVIALIMALSLTMACRTDAEAEAAILWPPDVKSQLTRKDSDAGKD